MMQSQIDVVGVDFISSYAGIQSLLVRTRSRNYRVDTHFPESDYHRSICKYKGEEYEKRVAGKVGCYTGASELLTLDVAVAFNRHRFAHFDGQVATILANPDRYGEYDPYAPENLFTVFLPATFSEEGGWTSPFTFEQVRDLAGIPANRAISLYKTSPTLPARHQLAA